MCSSKARARFDVSWKAASSVRVASSLVRFHAPSQMATTESRLTNIVLRTPATANIALADRIICAAASSDLR